MAYYEGEVSGLGSGSNNGFDGNGWWVIILFALIFGWGRGFGYGGNGGGSSEMAYDLGKVATTNDVASGFANSTILSNLNDLKLGQAGLQNTLCQGFNGINTSILTSTNGIERGLADLGYQNQKCCCETQRLLENGFATTNYNMAKNTCDIIQAGHNDTQRIIDFLTSEKISALQLDKATLTAQLSQNSQTATILNAVNRTPIPAYVVGNPYANYNPCGCNPCGYGQVI